MAENVEAVREIYRRFSVGDTPGILAMLAEDVRWDDFADNSAATAQFAWLVPRRGRQDVGRFFQLLAETVEIQELQLVSFMDGDDQVAAEVLLCFKVADQIFRDCQIHVWTFDDDGKVRRYRQFVDTAKYIEAARVLKKARAAL